MADVIWSSYGSSDELTPRELQRMRGNYAGECTLVDRWLGHFLDALGVYSFEGMTRFAFNLWASFPDNVAMECDFEMMIIDAPVSAEEATWSDLKALFR